MANRKANILVAFYSRDGFVEALAKAVVEGARSVLDFRPEQCTPRLRMNWKTPTIRARESRNWAAFKAAR